ncbi:holo-ACP synthase [Dissulfurirhabdus thermomarina]|uniref:Holo-[acyl-carrier-protein] synthase n=1 Tax=Dissulfurirhabdus thermomarina TaxID=1765737 RepID=A0A6N9TLR5_DISTH|nr:holo-ACP synthase [Dissulfurirhabdus thermomarina]NDY42222.1 holo-ACP synthase [Dissulfurirhabdus thermomarina]NMX24113.1 holo-ACP synthase [Dissulfurirhabdus thermomarina]
MIVGLGVDIVEIDRIARAVDRWGERFLGRVFTPEERAYCRRSRRPAENLALRFAAKEACSKALGTGMRAGVAWRQISVRHEPSGRPVLGLTGAALDRARRLGATAWHVSLSHERAFGVAVVVLEGRAAVDNDPGRLLNS